MVFSSGSPPMSSILVGKLCRQGTYTGSGSQRGMCIHICNCHTYIYIYLFIDIYTHVYTHRTCKEKRPARMYIHQNAHTSIHLKLISVCVCTYANMYIAILSIYKYMNIYISTYICICIFIYIYIHLHIYIHVGSAGCQTLQKPCASNIPYMFQEHSSRDTQ